ncbi:hypothetical protein IQ07DRAFT_388260 [Pyrenochaeta sp. DS3sAY3a]|nr:hypothetical protein IQ07DRAFT_388260 [Pyrenochaeta sp. DS3sAY3a]
MPPALDRLLASPSALRLLRSIVNAYELPSAFASTTTGCPFIATRRNHSSGRNPFSNLKWTHVQDTQDAPKRVRKPKAQSPVPDQPWQPEVEHDDARWAATLAHQERLRRLLGIESVWRACRREGYRLPTEDTTEAEFLWGTFISHPKLVEKVIDHAVELFVETGAMFPRLYTLVMRYWLQRGPREALHSHHQMLVNLKLKALPLHDLVLVGTPTFRPAAWEIVMEIYRDSNERDLYDVTVLPLIEKGNIVLARRWHNLCTVRDDMPSESVARHPVVQLFTAESSVISSPEAHFGTKRDSRTKSTTRTSRPEIGRYNQDLMQRMLGRDTAPVRFEDSFCARMFATRSIQPSSIIQGLAMVGVNEIGPQALLAMAVRTPIEELPGRFEELKASGIALQGGVFSLALEKFTLDKDWKLVRSLLDSDQHPDVFGDAEKQRKLLEFYLDNNELVQAQRTLAILTLFHKDSSAESWNMLLQVYIKRYRSQYVMGLLRDMNTRGVMLSSDSIIALRSLLRRRQPGRKPSMSPHDMFDDLRFVTRIFMFILESGMGRIAPSTWRELIRRFGMQGRVRELRRLLLWLLSWYAPKHHVQFANLPRPPSLDSATAKLRAAYPERHHYFHFPGEITQQESKQHPIRILFGPSLQSALVIWGFRSGLLRNAHLEQSMLGSTLGKKHYRHKLLERQTLKRSHWSVGLRMVVQLRDLGVHVHQHAVVKALQMQFIVLFGRGRSRKKENREMEKINTTPYAQYVQEVNQIWGTPLLAEPDAFNTGLAHDHMWHPRMRRRVNRKTSISIINILGQNSRNRDGEESSKTETGEGDRSNRFE